MTSTIFHDNVSYCEAPKMAGYKDSPKCQLDFGHEGACDFNPLKEKQTKMRPSLLPWEAIQEIVKVLEFGAKKHGEESWKTYGSGCYKDSLMRHIISYGQGEQLDEDSGLSVMSHIAVNALFLLWFELQENK